MPCEEIAVYRVEINAMLPTLDHAIHCVDDGVNIILLKQISSN